MPLVELHGQFLCAGVAELLRVLHFAANLGGERGKLFVACGEETATSKMALTAMGRTRS